MSRSLIIGLIITIAIISGLATFFYINFVKVKNRPAIDAVPNDAAIIFEIKNVQNTWASFAGTDMWTDLQQNEVVGQMNMLLGSIDSLVSANGDVQSFLADNKMTVSLHSNKGQNLNTLFIAETGSYSDIDGFVNWVAKVANGKLVKRVFDKEPIYEIQDDAHHTRFSIGFRDHLLIVSADATLVEESLRKLKYHLNGQGKGFEQAKTIAEVSSDVSVYINYQQFPSLMAVLNKDEYKEIHQYMKVFANWSVLDVKLEKDHIGISGVTFTDDSLFQFLDLFKTQTPVENDLSAYLPASTAYSLQLNFSNYPQFNSDLTEYLQNTGKLETYTKYTDSLEERYHISITDKLMNQMGNTALLGMNEGSGIDYQQQLFAVLSFRDNKAVDNIFSSYVSEIDKRGEGDSTVSYHNGLTIKRLQLGNMFKVFYGNTFEHLYSPYYVLKDNVFLMANDLNTLHFILDELTNNNTLQASESYKLHKKNVASSSNINLFLSPGKCLQMANLYGNENFISALNRYQFDFKKFEYIEVQYANSSNNSFFTNVNIKFNPSFKEETKVLWATQMDTTFDMQPVIVANSESQQPSIMVQDVLNNLYYISNSGEVLWKTKLSGKIISQIFEVDPNKNGEICYLFNTNKQVCLVTNKGNNIYGYPVRLPGTATAGINLFDFYGDSAFQYFVPLENNRIMGYQLNGKPVQGWNPKTINSRITTKLGGFTLSSGAYICGSSSSNQLFVLGLTNTQPKLVEMPQAAVSYPVSTFGVDTSTAIIWVTDTAGNFVKYSIDAQLTISTLQTIQSDASDYYHSIIGGVSGFTLLSASRNGFSLYNNEGTKMLSKTFTDSVTTLPFWSNTKDNTRLIGYTERTLAKVNWIDFKGIQYPSLPQEGVTPFITGDLFHNNADYLLCGDKKNNLRLYRLK